MPRLRIEHRTVYTYRQPVVFGRHRLVLRPHEGHELRVESMRLDIFPSHRLIWSRDVFNNSVAIVDFIDKAASLSVLSTVVLQRSLAFPRQDSLEPIRVPFPVEYSALEEPVVAAYRLPSFREDLGSVRSFLQSHPEIGNSVDAESMLLKLCAVIFQRIKYQRRMAKGVQSPAETLQLGSGSCRDVGALMMEAARSMGFAARFVSGYLDCPAAEAGRAAMHAWTEVYLPVLGWRSYDPTLAEAVSLKHIAVGVSNHPRGVMPISGMFTGAAADYIEMVAPVKLEWLDELNA